MTKHFLSQPCIPSSQRMFRILILHHENVSLYTKKRRFISTLASLEDGVFSTKMINSMYGLRFVRGFCKKTWHSLRITLPTEVILRLIVPLKTLLFHRHRLVIVSFIIKSRLFLITKKQTASSSSQLSNFIVKIYLTASIISLLYYSAFKPKCRIG